MSGQGTRMSSEAGSDRDTSKTATTMKTEWMRYTRPSFSTRDPLPCTRHMQGMPGRLFRPFSPPFRAAWNAFSTRRAVNCVMKVPIVLVKRSIQLSLNFCKQ